jgi:hypothetical protein
VVTLALAQLTAVGMSQIIVDDIAGRWPAGRLAEAAKSDRYWIIFACPVVAILFIAVGLLLD